MTLRFPQFSARDWVTVLLLTPALILLLAFFVAPMVLLGRVSLYAGGGQSGFGIGSGGFYTPGTWTLDAYGALLGDRYFWEVLAFTVSLGLGTALVTVLLAYPLSLFIHKLPPWWKAIALVAVVLPKLANPLVIIYGIQLLLSNSGPINQGLLGLGLIAEPLPLFHNLFGVVAGEIFLILPYAVLVLVTALDRIDDTLVPAAYGLGATTWAAFRRITLPLSVPGLSLAMLLSLIFALGAFESPYLLGSPQEITLAVDIQKQTFENLNWPRGAAEAMMMFVTLGICIAVYSLSLRSKQSLRRLP
ncbi:ABC transporter permease [Leptolyngbya sp. AN02str]|uniref:ABC transporter permease n=1 Tax=Leptolyngbya sp. AN02str TaxID=3423363 RepID=UPI003D31B940